MFRKEYFKKMASVIGSKICHGVLLMFSAGKYGLPVSEAFLFQKTILQTDLLKIYIEQVKKQVQNNVKNNYKGKPVKIKHSK